MKSYFKDIEKAQEDTRDKWDKALNGIAELAEKINRRRGRGGCR